jgi:hypothetical protein
MYPTVEPYRQVVEKLVSQGVEMVAIGEHFCLSLLFFVQGYCLHPFIVRLGTFSLNSYLGHIR